MEIHSVDINYPSETYKEREITNIYDSNLLFQR